MLKYLKKHDHHHHSKTAPVAAASDGHVSEEANSDSDAASVYSVDSRHTVTAHPRLDSVKSASFLAMASQEKTGNDRRSRKLTKSKFLNSLNPRRSKSSRHKSSAQTASSDPKDPIELSHFRSLSEALQPQYQTVDGAPRRGTQSKEQQSGASALESTSHRQWQGKGPQNSEAFSSDGSPTFKGSPPGADQFPTFSMRRSMPLSGAKEPLSELKTDVEKLLHELSPHLGGSETDLKACDTSHDIVHCLRTVIVDLIQRKEHAEKVNVELVEESAKLSSQMLQLNESYQGVVADQQSLVSDSKAKTSATKDLTEQVKELSASLAKQKETTEKALAKAHQEHESKLRNMEAAHAEELKQQKRAHDALLKQLTELKAMLKRKEIEEKEKHDKFSQLKAKMNAAEVRLEAARLEGLKLKKQMDINDELKQDLDQLRASKDQLEAHCKELDDKATTLQSQNESLQARLDQAETQNQQLRQKAAELTSQLENLRQTAHPPKSHGSEAMLKSSDDAALTFRLFPDVPGHKTSSVCPPKEMSRKPPIVPKIDIPDTASLSGSPHPDSKYTSPGSKKGGGKDTQKSKPKKCVESAMLSQSIVLNNCLIKHSLAPRYACVKSSQQKVQVVVILKSRLLECLFEETLNQGQPETVDSSLGVETLVRHRMVLLWTLGRDLKEAMIALDPSLGCWPVSQEDLDRAFHEWTTTDRAAREQLKLLEAKCSQLSQEARELKVVARLDIEKLRMTIDTLKLQLKAAKKAHTSFECRIPAAAQATETYEEGVMLHSIPIQGYHHAPILSSNTPLHPRSESHFQYPPLHGSNGPSPPQQGGAMISQPVNWQSHAA